MRDLECLACVHVRFILPPPVFQATLSAVRTKLEEWKAKARDLQTELDEIRTKFHDLQVQYLACKIA